MIPGGIFKESIEKFLQPIAPLLCDDTVSEIMINGPNDIWVERKGTLHATTLSFPNSQALHCALTNISQYCGKPINEDYPILETHLPDGSRLEAVLPPVAKNGPTVAIRRFYKSKLTISDLITNGTISDEAALFLAQAISQKKNIVISGGTGSGKTSLLCALSSFFMKRERIVVIEDTHELDLHQPHVVYLESRSADEHGRGAIRIRELLIATLRLRPDRILIGEVRGEEALDLIQAMTSGHSGSMTTVHANTPTDALRRFETMILSSQSAIPHRAICSQINSAIDIIVQINRSQNGRRLVNDISEVLPLSSSGDYQVHPEFKRYLDGPLKKVKRSES
ncbi:MAG: CpaF family protein [Deltaproteobacteria bacterium]|nr:CpaF family protein [Deltaproteobacteria bacterium]MBN2673344.1 CpaF family protein [Deltaproteobacteria bacterium]